jgi:xanthine dehydrogenase accessory factor
MITSAQSAIEHPCDVMRAAIAQMDRGEDIALAIILRTSGGSVRAPGAIMAVAESGISFGYLSGGCIDADVILHAQSSLQTGIPKRIAYGSGSPFMDIKLPCGGAIDLLVLPRPDRTLLKNWVGALHARREIDVWASDQGLHASPAPNAIAFRYKPKLRLRIAGRGADPIALARIATASGISAELWSPDKDCLEAVSSSFGTRVHHLKHPSHLPPNNDDPQTAFVLMFHDTDWEPAVLEHALAGKAFYVGAVGSRATHAKRRDILARRGLKTSDIDRIHGPIGLVPSMRDASMLAISAFAEIIAAFDSERVMA